MHGDVYYGEELKDLPDKDLNTYCISGGMTGKFNKWEGDTGPTVHDGSE